MLSTSRRTRMSTGDAGLPYKASLALLSGAITAPSRLSPAGWPGGGVQSGDGHHAAQDELVTGVALLVDGFARLVETRREAARQHLQCLDFQVAE